MLPRLDVRDLNSSGLPLQSEEARLQALGRLVGQALELDCLKPATHTGVAVPSSSSSPRCGACERCVSAGRLAAISGPWTIGTLNQALLLVRQPPVSQDFYDQFFAAPKLSDPEMLAEITRFEAYAMLAFGSIRFAFRALHGADQTEIRALLRDWAYEPAALRGRFATRPHGSTLVVGIPRDERWYIGYLSSGLLATDRRTGSVFAALLDGTPVSPKDQALGQDLKKVAAGWFPRLPGLVGELDGLQTRLLSARATGVANTAAYLAANHIDVYVATSMREKSDYLATVDLIDAVFGDAAVKSLNPTYFDPTLSFCDPRIDKGLVEALMLRRARCTLYMAQEVDTLGKDSELAATLALGKTVIVYVPGDDVATLERKLREAPLSVVRKRLLLLEAEGKIEAAEQEFTLPALRELVNWRPVFTLVGDEESDFRAAKSTTLDKMYPHLAAAEHRFFERRAKTLLVDHPLGMQVELSSGVANGVLVARDYATCAQLLVAALTNDFHFDITRVPEGTLLRERTTDSVYRVVTSDELLTNSFWHNYDRDRLP